jgi:hypothetical protein
MFDLRMFMREPASSFVIGNSAESMRANAVTYLRAGQIAD